jgi:hypothetical protein
MVKVIQASLTLFTSIAITALILAVVIPAHARSGAADHPAAVDIRPAVLTEYLGSAPGNSASAPTCPAMAKPSSGSSCPFLAGSASRDTRGPVDAREISGTSASGCPYLSARTAKAGCPALSSRAAGSACPFLSGTGRHDASPEMRGKDDAPLAMTL